MQRDAAFARLIVPEAAPCRLPCIDIDGRQAVDNVAECVAGLLRLDARRSG
jgi:hypothetical protein